MSQDNQKDATEARMEKLLHDNSKKETTAAEQKQIDDAKKAEVAEAARQERNKTPLTDRILSSAFRGGVPAMAAVGVQVTTLMWLRTAVNYQYRHGGTSMMEAIRALYAQGGIRRFYSGYPVAMIQAPLSRFGDTAANAAWLEVCESNDTLNALPIMVKTSGASVCAGLFRICLMPVDACKTSLQVNGPSGIGMLTKKVATHGPQVMFSGALAASFATFAGHYPWFATYNTLNVYLPYGEKDQPLPTKLLRSATLGFCSSFVSDCCSNSIRVVKTVRQTSEANLGYKEIVEGIIAKDGVIGLFGRGLTTKLVTNGIQGILFSVLWRLGQDYMDKQKK